MPINVGDRIRDYEIISSLGRGGMGQVYQVRHTISNRLEALKVIAPGRPMTSEIVERFTREIQLLASLHHPNITALHNAFRHDGELIMVMEFVEGTTLSTKLGASPMTLGVSLSYIQQVLSGLAYAHERGILHRDVKPSNIIISDSDQAKLLDFGLAMPLLGPEFTRTGTILGSPHYMSPEQVLGNQLDPRSDVYSVGVTLYQMVTGHLPFEGASEYSIASGHLRSIPVDPITLNSNLPVRLSEIVLKSLAKSPVDRFQTANELQGALGSLHSGDTATILILTHPNRIVSNHEEYREPDIAPRSPGDTGFDAGVLEKIIRDLAHHVGPIAKIVVVNAAKRTHTLNDLYELVAEEISTEQKRKAFLATRINYVATK